MAKNFFIQLTSEGIMLVLIVSLPSIIVATIVGVVVALIQALTQIQDQTLSYAVKLIATSLVLIFFMNQVFADLVSFTMMAFRDFPSYVR